MAYQTGTVDNKVALFDALDTFLTTKAGWVAARTLGPQDKIYTSNGKDGRSRQVIRIDGVPPRLDPTSPEQRYPHLNVRGYAAFDGVDYSKEFSQFGPYLWRSTWTVYGFNNPFAGSRGWALGGAAPPLHYAAFDGVSKVASVVAGGATTWWSDLRTLEGYALGSGGNPWPGEFHMIYIDRVPYVIGASATGTNWVLHNMRTGGGQTIENPPGAVRIIGTVWDGGNYLYAFRSGTTAVLRLDLQTLSWEQLSNTPNLTSSTAVNDGCTPFGLYLPASLGFLGSDDEPTDIILVPSNRNGPGSSALYRYNVRLDNWGPNVNAGTAVGAGGFLWWDGNHKMFSKQGSNTSTSFWDVATLELPSFARTDLRVWDQGTTSNISVRPLAPYVGKIAVPDDGTYWFVGDEDGVVVATEMVEGGDCHWAYFGRIDTPSHVAVSVSAVPAGVSVVEVDSVGSLGAGDRVIIYAPSSGKTTIGAVISVIDETHLELQSPYASQAGSLIGPDPTPWCLAGDGGTAVTPLNVDGFETTGVSASYLLRAYPPVTTFEQPNIRGQFTASPLQIHHVSNASRTAEVRGYLQKVYGIRKGDEPIPQHREQIYMDGKPYLVLKQTQAEGIPSDDFDHNILIGPLE